MTAPAEVGRAAERPQPPADGAGQRACAAVAARTARRTPTRIRDWAANGAASEYALSADEVVARSQPRTAGMSEGAAHFELANHLWRAGRTGRAPSPTSTSATGCSPTTGPTSARRGRWSATSASAASSAGSPRRPVAGEEADWPFESDFRSDVESLQVGGYYPKTL